MLRTLTNFRDAIAGVIIIAFIATVILFAPRTASAAFSNPGCTNDAGVSSYPIIGLGYEHANFATGPRLCIHAASSLYVSNLKNIGYGGGGDGYCNGQNFTSRWTWNDCISSDKWSLSCTQRLYYYADANYANLVLSRSGDGTDSSYPPFSFDNAISSIIVTYDRDAC
jgi:hypothetical protein